MNSSAPLKDFQKSLLRAQSEHAVQSIQVGLLFIVFKTLLGCSIGRLIWLFGFCYAGWKAGYLLIEARADQHIVPVYIISTAGVLYTLRILFQAYTTPGGEARHRTLTRPLWSAVHFQRLMALGLLLPAVLPIAARGHLPRVGGFDAAAYAETLAKREECIALMKVELETKRKEQRINAKSDGVIADQKRLQRQKTLAEADATSDPWKRRMLLQWVADNCDGDAWEKDGRKRDAGAVADLSAQIATYEAANAVLRRRGYLTELDRWGNEAALLMRKP